LGVQRADAVEREVRGAVGGWRELARELGIGPPTWSRWAP
jgi:hypothetical protein